MRQPSHKAAPRRNGKGAPRATLPLFDWAEQRAMLESLPMPPAATFIARRFAVSPPIARLVYELAGFFQEVNADA
ncbi:MAG: hypothetical protein O9322_14680 [Beijerinckiaceae bacterium]|nr:hypothetical protein [Beijerinckiaceae bacterium]MCZ8300593.1 hypothetical protein [Beijerinckiaceae bacterium]